VEKRHAGTSSVGLCTIVHNRRGSGSYEKRDGTPQRTPDRGAELALCPQDNHGCIILEFISAMLGNLFHQGLLQCRSVAGLDLARVL
jgi:hypothetical protein